MVAPFFAPVACVTRVRCASYGRHVKELDPGICEAVVTDALHPYLDLLGRGGVRSRKIGRVANPPRRPT